MKLPDFSKHEGLNRLRRGMGANYKERKWEDRWEPMGREDILRQLRRGKDVVVGGDVLDYGDDDTLAINGKRVLIYIRDVGSFGSRPKVHIAHCATLKGMVAANRGHRYVVSTRTDGIFQINVDNGYAGVQSEHVPLKICKNCLHKLNYKGYRWSYPQQKKEIFEDFRFDEFFDQYSETPTTWRPLHDNETVPLNAYTPDWDQIKNDVKHEANWTCQECGLDCSEMRKDLHVHHKDRNKANNNRSNLIALCHWCHKEQPGHGHMARNPS